MEEKLSGRSRWPKLYTRPSVSAPKEYIEGMADGYLIELTAPQTDSDTPAKSMWYAHIPDEDKAVAAVLAEAGSIAGTEAGSGTSVTIVRPLTHLILTEVSVPEGGVKPYD